MKYFGVRLLFFMVSAVASQTCTVCFDTVNFTGSELGTLYKQKININEYSSEVILLTDASQSIYQILFGDSTFVTKITAIFPANDCINGNEIKTSLQTIYYDKSYAIDPFATSAFIIDDSKSIFKFAFSSGSTWIYSIGGVKKESYDNEPNVEVIQLPDEDEINKEFADDCFNSFTSSERLTEYKVLHEVNEKINGFKAFGRSIVGKMDGKEALIFQSLIKISGNLILIQGFTYDEYEKYSKEFKNLVSTITKR